ncbi:POK8 protein, partial [Locustella ochotensis]|nr:POK8 protein [Locustella ochotensis]
DKPKFAFTVPVINNAESTQQYQWKVLPQGMRNSPIICQWYVAQALSGVRKQFPDAHLYHYMDGILVAAPTQGELVRIQPQLLDALHSRGLQVAPEKVQQQPPQKYLEVKILECTIQHHKVQFVHLVKTLNDAQKLVGTINWVHPLFGISSADLEPLFALLGGEPDLLSPRQLNEEAQTAHQKVADAISQRQSAHWAPELPFWLIVLNSSRQPHALIFQWDSEKPDPLLIIEWVFLPNNMPKTTSMQDKLMAMLIVKVHQRLTCFSGKDFDRIYLPLTMFYLNWLLQMSEKLQIALADYPGQKSIHLPKHKLLSSSFNLLPKPKRSETPLEAMTIFTDGS